MIKTSCDHWWVDSITKKCSNCGRKFETQEQYVQEMGPEKMAELKRRMLAGIRRIVEERA